MPWRGKVAAGPDNHAATVGDGRIGDRHAAADAGTDVEVAGHIRAGKMDRGHDRGAARHPQHPGAEGRTHIGGRSDVDQVDEATRMMEMPPRAAEIEAVLTMLPAKVNVLR